MMKRKKRFGTIFVFLSLLIIIILSLVNLSSAEKNVKTYQGNIFAAKDYSKEVGKGNFDLALKCYITKINDQEIQNPNLTLEHLKKLQNEKSTDLIFNQTKEKLLVKKR